MRLFSPALLVRALLCAAGGLILAASSARAQEGAMDATVNVGYIDGAIPRNTVRFRFDAAFDDVNPNRAEFLYAKGGTPGSPGPPLPESRINYQEGDTYLEWAVLSNFSAFIEGGVRNIDPAINKSEFGIGDMNAGFKWAFLTATDLVTTFQLRTYVPTGLAREGLGTGHVSLEPALLYNYRLNDFLVLEGELRYWVPIGGTDFSGDVVRYGVGLSYAERNRSSELWFSPVVEVVGWTVLSGKQTAVSSPTAFLIENAAGTSIVNVKAGFRIGYEDFGDLYIGYGHAVTDSAWYRDILRVELRWFF